MEYTTQMDAARKGIFTSEMAKVAEKEHLEPKKLMALMAEGNVIIPSRSSRRLRFSSASAARRLSASILAKRT